MCLLCMYVYVKVIICDFVVHIKLKYVCDFISVENKENMVKIYKFTHTVHKVGFLRCLNNPLYAAEYISLYIGYNP